MLIVISDCTTFIVISDFTVFIVISDFTMFIVISDFTMVMIVSVDENKHTSPIDIYHKTYFTLKLVTQFN